jgi:hypothetical protein
MSQTPKNALSTVPGGYGYTSAYLTWANPAGEACFFYPDLVISEEWDAATTVTEHPVEQGADVVDHVRVELVRCVLTIFATNEPIGPNMWDTPSVSGVSLQGGTWTSTAIPTSVTAQVWNAELAAKGALLAAGAGIGGAVGGTAGTLVGGAIGAIAGSLVQAHEVDTQTAISTYGATEEIARGVAHVQQFSTPQDYVQLTIDLIAFLKNTTQIVCLNGSKQTILSMVIEDFSYTRSEDEGTGALITIGLKEIRFVQTQTTTAPLPTFPGATTPTKAGQQNPGDGTPQQQAVVVQSVASSLAQALSSLFNVGGS